LAKEQRLPGRGNAAGLVPAFKEINAKKFAFMDRRSAGQLSKIFGRV
jgi:hypothetical protein